MPSDIATLHNSFEQLATLEVDLAPAIYARFAETTPESADHLAIMDNRMRGRMLDQIYQLLLGDVDKNYLAFETRMHRGYGATPELYASLFTAVKEAVREALADTWSPADEHAWDQTLSKLLEQIQALHQN